VQIASFLKVVGGDGRVLPANIPVGLGGGLAGGSPFFVPTTPYRMPISSGGFRRRGLKEVER